MPAATAFGACNIFTPVSGETATCDTAAPNPAATSIIAVPGSTGVTVNVLPGAELNASGNDAIVVRGQSSVLNQGIVRASGDFNYGAQITGPNANGSRITNQGLISISGDGAAAMAAHTNGNALVNLGTLTTTGVRSNGMYGNGGASGGQGNNALTNLGTIDTSGADAHAILSAEPVPGTITNGGSIIARGPGALGAYIANGASLINLPGGRIVSLQASAIIANGGGFIRNAGVISSPTFTISLADEPMTIENSGTIESLQTQAITMNGPVDTTILNTGDIVGGNGRGIFTDAGNDTFNWSAGRVVGFVRLDMGADQATLSGLSEANLAGVPSIDGGLGADTLTFVNSSASGFSRFINWENVNVTQNSRLTLDATGLRLGDSSSGTGSLGIDATSSLLAGGFGGGLGPTILPAAAGDLVTVRNAGTIDLTNGGSGTSDALAIRGNYVGTGGRLLLQTVLGADGSPSDKLIVAQGLASGTTSIGITNVGGAGALTISDGIMVVQATEGASTRANAFALAYGVSAGAYTYFLFRGGVTTGTSENWYLRSSLAPAPPPAPAHPPTAPGYPAPGTPPEAPPPAEPPALPASPSSPSSTAVSSPSPIAAEGTPPLPPPPPSNAPPLPLYRLEVPLYIQATTLARELGFSQLGKFNDRQGKQALLREPGTLQAAWGRAWGTRAQLAHGGSTDPSFRGTLAGVQAGQDLYADVSVEGHRNHYGFIVGYSRAQGDVRGFALGLAETPAGSLAIDGWSVGGYWTHVGPNGWYTDAVLLGNAFDVETRSLRGVGARFNGRGVSASLEGGLPMPLTEGFKLEPQVQVAWQHLRLDDMSDAISTASLTPGEGLLGRIGMRLEGQLHAGGMTWAPYARLDFWHLQSGADSTRFAGPTVVSAPYGSNSIEVGAGIVGRFGTQGAVYAGLSSTTAIGGEGRRSIVGGNAGMRWRW